MTKLKLKLKYLNITQHTCRDSGSMFGTRIHNNRVRKWMNGWVTRNDAIGEKRSLVEVPYDFLDCNNCTPWRPVAPSRVATLSCKLEHFTPAPGLVHNPSPNPSSMAGDITHHEIGSIVAYVLPHQHPILKNVDMDTGVPDCGGV